MSIERPPPQLIVIFGASGDLARRKLLPGLYNLARDGGLPERYAIIGYSRTGWDDEAFRTHARDAIEEFSRTPIDEVEWKAFSETLSYVSGTFDEERCFAELDERMRALDGELGAEGRRLYFCSTPPSVVPQIAARLAECAPTDAACIVVEKPFGDDLESARTLHAALAAVFAEERIFRIDHYLGKETLQNILVFRFFNTAFERLWHKDAIDHVQITVSETIGVGARAGFYEATGALRDMVQSHLLQVVAFLTMEPPRSLEAESIRDAKLEALRALRPFSPSEVVRGRYTAGTVEGEEVVGYLDAEDVPDDSDVETFVAIRAHVDNGRWEGVPFFLRTGKRMERRTTEAVVVFRESLAHLPRNAGLPAPEVDHLKLRIQPDQGISFAFQAKIPGAGLSSKTVSMDFDYEEAFGTTPTEAYERLLHDALSGDQTLFLREDSVERAWQVVEPVLDDPGPLAEYAAGSWGPEAANDLIAPRAWHGR